MLYHNPLAYPSLENLSYLLRHREEWPENFYWNFKFISCCAIGLAEVYWAEHPSAVRHMFNSLPFGPQVAIFFNASTKPKVPIALWFKRMRRHDEVTPEMVADQIDAYLQTKEEEPHVDLSFENSREVELSRVPA